MPDIARALETTPDALLADALAALTGCQPRYPAVQASQLTANPARGQVLQDGGIVRLVGHRRVRS